MSPLRTEAFHLSTSTKGKGRQSVEMGVIWGHFFYISNPPPLYSYRYIEHACKCILRKCFNLPAEFDQRQRRDVISGHFCGLQAFRTSKRGARRRRSIRQRTGRVPQHRAQGQAHDGAGTWGGKLLLYRSKPHLLIPPRQHYSLLSTVVLRDWAHIVTIDWLSGCLFGFRIFMDSWIGWLVEGLMN